MPDEQAPETRRTADVEAMAAAGSRIAMIEARIASLAHPPAAATAATGTALRTAPPGTATSATFAQALASATAPTPTTAPAAPLTAAQLRSHGNGRIPEASLTSIGGGERLYAPAAEAFTRMRDAAKAQGVTLGVNDSYRSYEQQVDVAARKGLYSQGGLAAKPGTSDHGWGKAVDLQLDGRALSWMRANGERFGFVEDTPREPWHWVHKN